MAGATLMLLAFDFRKGALVWLGAGLVVATIVAGAIYDGPIGVPLAPFAMRADPSLGVGALAAAAVLGGCVWWLPRASGRWLLPALFASALAARLAVNAARADGLHGWTETFDLARPEGPLEYLAGRDALVYGREYLLDRFAELVPSLPVHVAGHPPGLLLSSDLLGIDTAAELAALCIGCGALVAPLTYALARNIGLATERARIAGALAVLAPGAVLMGATSADALYATLATAAAALLVTPVFGTMQRRGQTPALHCSEQWWPAGRVAAGAVVLAVASFFSWALLAAGAFAAVVVLQRDGWRAAAVLAAACAVATVAFHGALALAFGWDPIGTIAATGDVYRLGIASIRPYWYWVAGSPAAWAAFSGLAISALWLVALARREPAAIALAAIVLVAAVLGFSKAETERIWLFMLPYACVAAAAVLPPRRLAARARPVRRSGAGGRARLRHGLVTGLLRRGDAVARERHRGREGRDRVTVGVAQQPLDGRADRQHPLARSVGGVPAGSSSTEMLTMPPALATKSGTQRMSRSASAAAWRTSASWLLAAPQTTVQRSAGIESSSSTPPSAHGARTSTSARIASSGVVHSAPSSAASAWRSSRMSASSSRAPACAHSRASGEPTWPQPTIATRRPASSSEPSRWRSPTRIASNTPSAVHGLGSPEPPRDSSRPVTCAVRSATTSMSAVVTPTSSAVW